MQDLHKRLTQTSLIPNWISAWFYKAAHRKVSGLSCSLFRSREGNGEPWLARKSDCIPSDASGISLCIYQGFTRLHGLFAGLRCLSHRKSGYMYHRKTFFPYRGNPWGQAAHAVKQLSSPDARLVRANLSSQWVELCAGWHKCSPESSWTGGRPTG